MRYKYKTEPYMHQRDVLNTSWNKDDWALFLDMGTGKSKIIIDNAAMLYDIGKINGLVIVAPKGVYLNWIEEEIPRHLPERIPHKMAAYVSGAKSQVKLRRLKRLFESGDELHILVINVEALATKAGYAVVERFLGNHESMFVIDESTTIKNPKANRTVAALRLSNHAVYRRIASGAPITQSPMDLYAQCAFLDPELLGFASYYAFRNRYAIMKDMYVGPRSFKSVIGFKNLDELSKKLEGFSSRVLKGQCLDLPPKIYQVRKVPLTDEQDFHYHNLLKYATSKIEEEQVSVTIILTLLQKLHQVCCGFIKMDTGVEKRLDERREHELIQILDETSGKAIIWCYYQYNIRSVTGRLKRVFGVNSTASYFGETT